MDSNIEKRLIAIYDTFGEASQESKLFEECVELLNAIESGIKKDIISELADVFCVTLQFYLKNKQIQKAVVDKITRTEERIESGFYERED
jgi:NTP pyrophosphatase (non-canonical NTP hydrolase)